MSNNYYFGGNEGQKNKKDGLLNFSVYLSPSENSCFLFSTLSLLLSSNAKILCVSFKKKVQHPPNVYGMLVTSMTHKKNKFLPFADVSRKNLANFGLLILLNSTQPVLNNQGKCFLYFMTKIYSTIFVLLYISLYEKGI